MENDDEQDKSEEATPFKLHRARRRGVVARGMDLPFMAVLGAALGLAWLGGEFMAARMAALSEAALIVGPQTPGDKASVLTFTGRLLSGLARPVAFGALTVFAAVLLIEIVQVGPVFSAAPFKPDFSRMNPAKNLKRIFSRRMLSDTAKNTLKLALYGLIAFGVLRFAQVTVSASIADARGLAEGMREAGLRLLFFFVLAAAIFAILDQLIVRRDFARRMRMSRRELKREMKDREGDPRMKQRRKSLHAEFVKMSQSLRNIRGSDLLITNPTHFAVALRYDPKTMSAPRVVARGAHQFAQRLKRLAFLYGVVIVENPPLARALYQSARLDRDIPDAFFQPVADLYIALRRRRRLSGATPGV